MQMVGAMEKQTPSPGRRKRSVRTDTPEDFPGKEVIRQNYMSLGLEIAKCIDILVTASPLPIITLYTAAVPLSLWSLALAQALYFFPQLWSTVICDRFARRFNGITTYTATLIATAISSFITANALRTHSLFLYLLARFVNGLFRHALSFSALAARELSDASKGYDTQKISIFSLMAAMLFGGVLGEYATDVAAAIEMLATMEFATAVTLMLLSFTCTRGTRTAPGATSVEEYKNWLLRQPYSCISFFVPTALCVSCASMSQCMYPFIDRQVFQLHYVFIGLHMAVVIAIEAIIAPVLIKRCGEMNQWMIHTCAAFLLFGSWLSPWVSDNGLLLYLGATMLFTDLPAAMLGVVFSSVAENGFKTSDRVFSSNLHRHVKQFCKQWSPILLIFVHSMLIDRQDATRVVLMPFSVGLVTIILTNQIKGALAAIFVSGWAIGTFSSLGDEGIWVTLISTIGLMMVGRSTGET
ncbi:hypothetical protein C3747_44g165 [Trypanosoma cruzi]|uniref:Uncharacterized protein n=1 Tax=Trypanosoma cruzi TaxID=5693 RepID=A0A2V2WXN8_TRYCR|nr:hypothetical protein C3747_44g165 [Trypanosoma cruzi]